MPSPSYLRELSDEAVLRALMATPRLTRAELAVVCELSKPTVADSVRRLETLGLVADTGERTAGRGGVGSYYALAEGAGYGLAVAIAPDGIVAEVLDAAGVVLSRAAHEVARPATPAAVRRSLVSTARAAVRGAAGPVGVAVVSAADPVDRRTGDLVHLPDAPFLLGDLSPAAALRPLVDGPVHVDNDVNWAARAEREQRLADGEQADDVVYLYLGEGLGCAVTADGTVLRGHSGLAGEIAHLVTPDAHGRASTLIEVFGALGVRHERSTAIDVPRLLAALDDRRRGHSVARTLARVLHAVIAAATAFCDPGVVVLGGPWSESAALQSELRVLIDGSSRPVPLESARVTTEAPLTGARTAAVRALRDDLVARARTGSRVSDPTSAATGSR